MSFENNEVIVEYSIGECRTIQQKMTQKKLSDLLKNPEMCLFYVNKPKKIYRRKAVKK